MPLDDAEDHREAEPGAAFSFGGKERLETTLAHFLAPDESFDGGYNGAEVKGVAAVPSGGLVAVGSYNGKVLASGVTPPLSLGSPPGSDGFIARFGAQPWFVRVGGTSFDEVVAVAVDPQSEDVWVLGDFRGTVTFQTAPVASAGGGDIFLARYSKTGTLISVRYFGGPGEDFARGLVIDPFGRALVAGEFENTASFGVGNLTSTGDSDVFLGCFAP